jgi:predicted RNA binding protein YcfA (HicA-like mRNA interferase family)
MSKLPAISGARCVTALKRIGFVVRRQRGSHIVLTCADPYAMVVVPDHKTMKPGTLRGIIRDASMTVDEFVMLLMD